MKYANPAKGIEVEVSANPTFAESPIIAKGKLTAEVASLNLKELNSKFWNVLFHLGLIYASFILAYLLRYMAFNLDGETPQLSPVSFQEYLIIGLGYSLVLLGILLARHFDIIHPKQKLSQSLLTIGNAILVSTASITLVMLIVQPNLYFSRLVFIFLVPVSWITLGLSLVVIHYFRRNLWHKGIGVRRLLVVGATDLGVRLMHTAAEKAHLGYKLVGFVDDELRYSDWVLPARYGNNIKRTNPEVPYLGTTDKLVSLLQQNAVDEVIVALPMENHQLMLDVVKQCQKHQVAFSLAPSLSEVRPGALSLREINGIPVIATGETHFQGLGYALKRAIDVFGSLALILVMGLPMLLIALAIKLDSSGPIIFRQTRVGKHGKAFTFYKFRSMYTDADARLAELEKHNETNGATFKMKNDPRVTKVGRFIRRTSLDELPQLFNILLGDMTLVGPRPGLQREVMRYQPWQHRRLEATPGLTGLWQVNGRSSTTFEDMVKLDIYYVDHWSLSLDIQILIKTVKTVLKGEGAY